jgi:hypothetical protein
MATKQQEVFDYGVKELVLLSFVARVLTDVWDAGLSKVRSNCCVGEMFGCDSHS